MFGKKEERKQEKERKEKEESKIKFTAGLTDDILENPAGRKLFIEALYRDFEIQKLKTDFKYYKISPQNFARVIGTPELITSLRIKDNFVIRKEYLKGLKNKTGQIPTYDSPKIYETEVAKLKGVKLVLSEDF